MVFKIYYRPIPNGLCVRHKCDNTGCCNPEHLELRIYQDNMDDRQKRGRTARCSQIGKSKLTDDQVKEIWFRLDNEKSAASIARIFAVNPKTIYDIKNGKI